MPMIVNVGISKKVGEPDYGSRGASINVGLELDSALISAPDKLQERIRQLFELVRSSVDKELNGNGNGNGLGSENGHAKNGTTGNGCASSPNPRPATSSQIKAINAIALKHRVDLPLVLQNRFQLTRLEDLSIRQASELIDTLKSSSRA